MSNWRGNPLNILKKIYHTFTSKGAWILLPTFLIGMFMPITASVQAAEIPNAGFEDGTFTDWDKGAQTGTLGSTITGTGTGVTIFTGPRTFTHSARGARGTSTSPYYSAAVPAGSWTFSPNNGTNAVLLQPRGAQTFSQATTALDLSAGAVTEIRSTLSSQAQASGNGSGNPTDASWITRTVELTAGVTYTMAWNYVGTDYVPYNDGSITSLVPVTVSGTPVVTVNNYVKSYAFLGFTNPGTGDYSTNSFGSTGWQNSTYEVSISGIYKLGFTVFNLDDQSLSPALMVDSEIGSTERCASGTCTTFGGVVSNSPTAPTVAPTTTTTSTTSTTVAQTTTTSSTTTTSTSTTSTSTSTTIYVSDGSTTTSTAASTTTIATTTSTLPTPVVQIVVPIEVPSVTNVPVQVVTEPVLVVPTGTTLPSPVTESTLTTSPVTTLVPTPKTDTTLITETTSISLPVIPDGTIAKPTSPNTTVKITETTAVKTTETTVVVPLKVKTVTNDILDMNATPKEVDKALDKVLDSNFTDTQLAQVVGSVFSDITKTEQVTALVASFLEKDLSTKELTTVMEAVFNDGATVSQMSAVVDDLLEQDLSIKELTAVFDAAFDEDLSDKETIDLIVDVLAKDLTLEILDSVLGTVFDKEVSNEVLIQTFTAVLGSELNKESVGVIVGVLESDTITNQQVATVVTLIIEQEGGVDSEQATELATSSKVLESIYASQATEVFGALVVPQISSEDGLAIVSAIEEAPKEVKESFEKEINIFTGVFDTYTSIGSTVDTGSRRTLIAATTAVATIATAVSTGGGSGGSTGGSGGGSGGSGGTNTEGRSKKEEEGEEPAGEIAGPGDDEDSNFTKNSIFKYYTKEGIEMRKFDWLGFAKKLWDITAGLAFTFAGSVVVYYTLSGTTQTIALVSTVTACVVHYTHQILKNDKD